MALLNEYIIPAAFIGVTPALLRELLATGIIHLHGARHKARTVRLEDESIPVIRGGGSPSIYTSALTRKMVLNWPQKSLKLLPRHLNRPFFEKNNSIARALAAHEYGHYRYRKKFPWVSALGSGLGYIVGRALGKRFMGADFGFLAGLLGAGVGSAIVNTYNEYQAERSAAAALKPSERRRWLAWQAQVHKHLAPHYISEYLTVPFGGVVHTPVWALRHLAKTTPYQPARAAAARRLLAVVRAKPFHGHAAGQKRRPRAK